MDEQSVLNQSIEVLSTIGPKKSEVLIKTGIKTLEDLFYYFPRRYLDRSNVVQIRQLREGQEATIIVKIVRKGIKPGRRKRFILMVSDGTGFLTCVWFSQLNYWQRIFNIGDWLALSGKIGNFGGLQMSHPEFDRLNPNQENKLVHTGKIIPLYPSSEALTRLGFDSRGFRRLMTTLFQKYHQQVEEILPRQVIEELRLMPLKEALRNIHFPDDFDRLYKAKRRLKFDELYYMQVIIALRRHHTLERQSGIKFDQVGNKVKALADQLPFELTGAQKQVLREIRSDMKSSRPMNRLLQGDVGSGKTIVALVALLIAVENGYQGALMAPTEILAEQHYFGLKQQLDSLSVTVTLLIGGQAKAERQSALADIQSGVSDIIVGTHALIQENVNFANLGLVIIDEQHRFGVLQRGLLREKGLNPDVLVMTATPIPRTLSKSLYGDLDVSILDEMPQGRKPIQTVWRPETKRGKIYAFLREQIRAGEQAFIVFPLVEESEKSDLKAATDSYEKMSVDYFKGIPMGLLHGRMKPEEKEAVMAAFKAGELRVLVSTTVIEVGVDVPNATIMIIEHAERFGLTQLHQLRGRVGRGDKQSYCILIGYGELTDEARKRLDTMVETTDGFKIAEVDLKLRGPGEFFGTRQSGLPDLKIADLVRDADLMNTARRSAFALVKEDPHLRKPEHSCVRTRFLKNYKEKFEDIWEP
ncbi:ATP-dependent DNA helicase RecG [candidate division KSB1 bacterium]|nr:ATP-dependent DNA helicase RecG [candidate division KSB1 bacterium]